MVSKGGSSSKVAYFLAFIKISFFWLLTTLYQHVFVKATLSVISFGTGWTTLLRPVTGVSSQSAAVLDVAKNGVVISSR
jgi:hypothetical protein